MFIPRICWLYGINLFTILRILYVDITSKRVKPGVIKGKSLNFSHLICDSYQAKINRSFLICEEFPSLLYLLVFFPIFQDRVTAILCRDGRKCHRSELSQKPNLCL